MDTVKQMTIQRPMLLPKKPTASQQTQNPQSTSFGRTELILHDVPLTQGSTRGWHAVSVLIIDFFFFFKQIPT